MGLMESSMIPPVYPADLVRQIVGERKAPGSQMPGILWMLIMEYRERRGGKRPAKIFLNKQAFNEIVGEWDACYQVRADGEVQVFGIPAGVFCGGEGPEIYLSDETES